MTSATMLAIMKIFTAWRPIRFDAVPATRMPNAIAAFSPLVASKPTMAAMKPAAPSAPWPSRHVSTCTPSRRTSRTWCRGGGATTGRSTPPAASATPGWRRPARPAAGRRRRAETPTRSSAAGGNRQAEDAVERHDRRDEREGERKRRPQPEFAFQCVVDLCGHSRKHESGTRSLPSSKNGPKITGIRPHTSMSHTCEGVRTFPESARRVALSRHARNPAS